MKLIQISFLLIFSLVFSSTTFAQGPRGGGHERGFAHIVEFLNTKLELSEEQASQLEVLVDDFDARAAALRNQDFENRGERRTAMLGLHRDFREAISEILTDSQLTILDELPGRGGERAEGGENPCDFENVDREALHAALEAYRTENIVPAMLELRADFNENISEEDQLSIATLRTAFATFKSQILELKMQAQEEGADREAIRTEMKELKQAMRDEHELLKKLVHTYKEDMKTAFESLAPQKETWSASMRAIKVEYLGEDCVAHLQNRGGHGGRGGQGHEGRGDRDGRHGAHLNGERAGHHGHGHRHHKKGAKKGNDFGKFLLLNPSGGNLATKVPTEKLFHTLSVSPNPAFSTTTLTYKVVKESNITILLLDNEGTVLKEILNATTTIGTHTIEVDLSRYRTGAYYFSLSDGAKVISERAVISQR